MATPRGAAALVPRTLDKGPRTSVLLRSFSRREGFVRHRWSDTGAGASTFGVSIYKLRLRARAYVQRSRYPKQVNFVRLRSLVTPYTTNFIDDVSENVECFEESSKNLLDSSLALGSTFNVVT